jgi:hypothetical protein
MSDFGSQTKAKHQNKISLWQTLDQLKRWEHLKNRMDSTVPTKY